MKKPVTVFLQPCFSRPRKRYRSILTLYRDHLIEIEYARQHVKGTCADYEKIKKYKASILK